MNIRKSESFGIALVLAMALGVAVQATAGSGAKTLSEDTMDFDKCLLTTQRAITSLGVPANRVIPIVNTGILQITKIVADDGNIVITCSKPDRKMVITQSTPPDWHLVR